MFQALRDEILRCDACAERFGYAPHPVVFGSERARVVQISQAPSATVHRTLRPFDDASGRRLRGEWYGISDDAFYDPRNFYITALAHCYPGKSPHGGDRLPPKCCARRWLHREIELVDNRIYVLIGGLAANHFFPGRDLADLSFHDQILNGKPAYVLPHPSPLNVRWFIEHPDFLGRRIGAIRDALHRALFAP